MKNVPKPMRIQKLQDEENNIFTELCWTAFILIFRENLILLLFQLSLMEDWSVSNHQRFLKDGTF